MARDYREHLDEAALGLLAETTGFASRADASHFFRDRPHDIGLALASPQAVSLLERHHSFEYQDRHRLLQLAIAVHRTAEEICQAGWTTAHEGYIDLSLVRFSGQTQYQQFVVGLLASFLRAPAPIAVGAEPRSAAKGPIERMLDLADLCDTVNEFERAGALRLLGDEALFSASVFPESSHALPFDDELAADLASVLPRAVRSMFEELRPELSTVLDAQLMFGPIWYRMAAQNLLHTGVRGELNNIATDFATARRFLVRVAQGPLADLRHSLYPHFA